jgi:hypothetical protein
VVFPTPLDTPAMTRMGTVADAFIVRAAKVAISLNGQQPFLLTLCQGPVF